MGRWLAMVLVIIGASSYGLLSSFIKMAYDQGFTEGQITPAQMTMGTLCRMDVDSFSQKIMGQSLQRSLD